MTAPYALRVLIVDDMPELRKILGHFVRQTIHAEIVEAGDGIEAIEQVLQKTPDILFCDLNMPGMTGFEFLGFFTRQPNKPACPIIVLTSEEDEESRMQAIDFSVDSYLRKPFDADTVLRTLRAYIPEEFFMVPADTDRPDNA
jgi:CheY-like chemotaxis protein